MKTVDTLLRKIYPGRLVFNRQERRYLRAQNITNGVWAAKGINIWEIVRRNIEFFPQFNADKVEAFVRDWERGSDAHDVEYYEWNRWWSRVGADWRFAKFTAGLCHWAGKKNASRIRWIVFWVLFRCGSKAYNYGSKKHIEDSLPDNIKSWE